MAKLVAAVGTPHGPMLPQQVAEAPGKLRAEALMTQVREQLEAAAPDVIIEVASDHFTNFFYNNLPQFCIGAMPEAEGPTETYCVMPHRVVRGRPDLAKKVLSFGLKSSFDLAMSEEFRLDHSVLVPLHFLTPGMDIPVVPLYVNGLAPPLPSARRCYALGQALRRFIDQWDSDQRVALLASGSFSLEVGGPRVGYTDKPWVNLVSSLLEQGNYRSLARRATEQRMSAAGNVSGELLCWITVAGALGETRPLFVEIEQGGGFAAWALP
jgi:hypothetical protein